MVAPTTVCHGSPRDGSLSSTSSEGSRTPPSSPQPPCHKRAHQGQQHSTQSAGPKGTKRAREQQPQQQQQPQHVDHKQQRMLERKRRNRESAERSRQRRIQYYKQLETDVTGLRAENAALRTEVEQLRKGNVGPHAAGNTAGKNPKNPTAADAIGMVEMRAQNAALQAQVERLQAELAAQLQPRKRVKANAGTHMAQKHQPAHAAGPQIHGMPAPWGAAHATAASIAAPANATSSNRRRGGRAARSNAQSVRISHSVADDAMHRMNDPLYTLDMAGSPLGVHTKQHGIKEQVPQGGENNAHAGSGNDDLECLLEDVLTMEMGGANLFPSDPTFKELELSSLENDEAVDLDSKFESAAFKAASCKLQKRGKKTRTQHESSILTPMIKTLDQSANSPQLERFDPHTPVIPLMRGSPAKTLALSLESPQTAVLPSTSSHHSPLLQPNNEGPANLLLI